VFTVWNGVDLERFCLRDQSAMRARLNITQEIPVAGIVAALRPEKQHVMLVESWANVVGKLPDALLVVVGDGAERAAIERKAEELGISENVRMLGTRHDVPEVLSAMDLKVLSSRMEANPASTLEAGACGLPVVAPNVGSLPDTVIQGETGLLVAPNDPAKLSDAMLKILSLPDRGRSMGQAAHDLVRKRFSVEVMVGGYECLIDGVYRAAAAGTRLTPAAHDQRMEELIEQVASERAEPILPAASIVG
jgi:glycosyltransferase involved in cell wall biosynthesis